MNRVLARPSQVGMLDAAPRLRGGFFLLMIPQDLRVFETTLRWVSQLIGWVRSVGDASALGRTSRATRQTRGTPGVGWEGVVKVVKAGNVRR